MAQQKPESLPEILTNHGWQETEKGIWKHPKRLDQKIVVYPTRWDHLKLDISKPQDWRILAGGTSSAELKKHLSFGRK